MPKKPANRVACPRCSGTGIYEGYGTCYRCNGRKTVKPAPVRKERAPIVESDDERDARLRASLGDADFETLRALGRI